MANRTQYSSCHVNLSASGIYFGSPFGYYPTFHNLTNVGRKQYFQYGKRLFPLVLAIVNFINSDTFPTMVHSSVLFYSIYLLSLASSSTTPVCNMSIYLFLVLQRFLFPGISVADKGGREWGCGTSLFQHITPKICQKMLENFSRRSFPRSCESLKGSNISGYTHTPPPTTTPRVLYTLLISIYRPSWERRAIAIACNGTRLPNFLACFSSHAYFIINLFLYKSAEISQSDKALIESLLLK